VHSVLALSDLHHGSRLQSKLPITTHSAHDISKLMLYGIKPPNEEGFTPWWL